MEICKAVPAFASTAAQEEPDCGVKRCRSPHVHAASISLVPFWTISLTIQVDSAHSVAPFWGFLHTKEICLHALRPLYDQQINVPP